MIEKIREKIKTPSGARQFWFRFRQDKKALVGLFIISTSILIGLFAPIISPYDPYEMTRNLFQPPSMKHLLGTDNLGRDVLSRIMYGTRISILFGVGVGMISLFMGIILGAIPGYYGGWIDSLFSRIFEFFMLIPRLFLIIYISRWL
ncbi:ABC transporter permease [Thermoproteota archaeon]